MTINKTYDYDVISGERDYWGTVIYVDDKTKTGRIKVNITGIYSEGMNVDLIPFAMPRYQHREEHTLPALSSKVQIRFRHGNVYMPEWWQQRGAAVNLSNDDYASGIVLVSRNLEEFDLKGNLSIRYTESEGLLLELTKNNKLSTFIIRPDNTVFIKNGNTGKVVHISSESISIGTEVKSAEPGVLGDQNKLSLESLDTNIQDVVNELGKFLDKLKSAAQSSPYTAALVPSIIAGKTAILQKSTEDSKKSKEQFPKTLSKIVTLD